MTERRIKMNYEDAKKFVNIASRCEFDIDISYNRYVVDAKSYLGVMGLNFNQILTVEYCGYNEELERFLMCYAMAC